MSTDDPRQRLQRDLDEAYRRGQLDETVRAVKSRMDEISRSVQGIQETMAELTKTTVPLSRLEALEVRVRTLETWKIAVAAVGAAFLTLSQVLPRLVDYLKSGP